MAFQKLLYITAAGVVVLPVVGLWASDKAVPLPYDASLAPVQYLIQKSINCHNVGKVFAPKSSSPAPDANGCIPPKDPSGTTA